MANWALYCRDAVFGRTENTEVTATQNAAYAANVVDGNPSNVWQPSSTAAFTFGFYTGATSVLVKAVAICNHSLAGEVVTLSSTSSLLTPGTQRGQWTIPDNEDCVLAIASPSTSAAYWNVDITGATTSDYIGGISLLDNVYYFEFDYPSAPRLNLAASASPGAAVIRSAAGAPMEMPLGGVAMPFPLQISTVDLAVDSTGVGRKILNWYREGGSHRVWVTDDTWGVTTANQGRGLYCFLPSVDGRIMYPTARGELYLPFEIVPYDGQGS